MAHASALFRLGRRKTALGALVAANNADPTNWEPPFFLGHLLLEAGRMEDASSAYRNAITKVPPVQTEDMGPESVIAKAYNNLGLTLKAAGEANRPAAREAYEAAAELGPNLPHGLVNLGVWHINENSPEVEQEAVLKKAADGFPGCREANFNAGVWYKERNRLREGLHYLTQALRVDPSYCQAAVHKALVEASLGTKGTAMETLNAVVAANNGGCALAHAYLGPLRLLHGFQVDGPIEDCRKAIELSPTLLEAYGCLSTMLMVRREYKEAAATIELVRANARHEDQDDTVKLAYAYQNICYWRKFKELSRDVRAIIERTMGGSRRIASQAT